MAHVLKGSQFYLHTPHSSANGMNHTCFAFPDKADTHLPTPGGWKAELALGGWLLTYQNRCPAPEIEPGHGRPYMDTNKTIPSSHSIAGNIIKLIIILTNIYTVCSKKVTPK